MSALLRGHCYSLKVLHYLGKILSGLTFIFETDHQLVDDQSLWLAGCGKMSGSSRRGTLSTRRRPRGKRLIFAFSWWRRQVT